MFKVPCHLSWSTFLYKIKLMVSYCYENYLSTYTIAENVKVKCICFNTSGILLYIGECFCVKHYYILCNSHTLVPSPPLKSFDIWCFLTLGFPLGDIARMWEKRPTAIFTGSLVPYLCLLFPITVYRRQILTSKVDPRAVRVDHSSQIYICAPLCILWMQFNKWRYKKS